MSEGLVVRKGFSAASANVSLHPAIFIFEPAMFYGRPGTTSTIQLAFPSKEN
jgi:hypothetical protein